FDFDVKVAVWASLAIALIFLVLAFTVARRSHEIFIGFSAVFLALIVHQWHPKPKAAGATNLVMLIPVLALVYAPIASLSRVHANMDNMFRPAEFQAVGEWLAQHAQPGEIVFNLHWDRFGDLFFWNPSNYYVNGMDPIFEYAYDPHLYWKTHYLANDGTDEFT